MVQSYFRVLIGFLLLFWASLLQAQLQDDFSDGDLDNNPSWIGAKGDFVVSAEQLQLNATGGGKSYLALKADWKDTASWEFYTNLEFAPSTSNQLDVYLSFDKADLTADGEGYFLRIGKSGTEDNLEFYKKSGSTTTKLGEGALSTLGASTNEVRVRVTRSSKGEFEVYADFSTGTTFNLDFKVTDNSFSEGAYFGFSCKYTSTRADKFLFDDVRIDPIFKDVVAPDFYQINVIDAKHLQLVFDEALDSTSAVQTSNYDINGTPPLSATFSSANATVVLLELGSDLVSGTTYTVEVNGVEDLAGNPANSDSEMLSYFKAQLGDVIINEVFPDPTPTRGLPEEEFVELYNRSGADINLMGWSIADATGASTLPSVLLKDGEYLILCSEAAAPAYSGYGQVATLSLPSLNNSGDDVILRTGSDELIDKISYDDTWYNDALRALGGYSIERINPESICSGSNNWKATVDDNGGTPGTQNAVFDNSPDETAPDVESIKSLSATTFILYFDEPFDSLSAATADYEAVGIGNPISVVVGRDNLQVTLEFATALTQNRLYDLEVDGVKDCEGNLLLKVYKESLVYVVTTIPSLHDVLITEIFADPTPSLGLPEAEYLELRNVSDKVIELGSLVLSAGNESALLDSMVFQPDATVVLCKSSESFLFEDYPSVVPVSGFPGLNNGGELIELRTRKGTLIHFVSYSNDWYSNDESKGGGYSLEMIDTDNPCNGNVNWTSARENVFGTPGTENSNKASNPDIDAPVLAGMGVVDSRHLYVQFSETLDSFDLANDANYLFPDNSDLNVIGFAETEVPFDRAVLTLSQGLQISTIYELEISNMKDCEGNRSGTLTNSFALPMEPYEKGMVINEVLFNPETGGVDFVELYNRSEYYFDLSEFLLTNRGEDGMFGTVYSLVDVARLVPPKSYVVLTTGREDILNRYEVRSPDALLQVDGMPSMPDAEGEVVLLSLDSSIIDELQYDSDWHYTLLEDDEGYSLERIDPEAETQSQGNWHTASSVSGGATPTYINSQFRLPRTEASTVTLSGESFSPDNDGFDDFVQISIQSEGHSQSVSIKVYNLSGQMVRNLVPHDVLGNKSVYQWNGFTDLEERAPIGVYIFLVEVVNLETGTTERFKESVVLAGRI